MYDSIMRLAQEVAGDLEHHDQMIKYLESELSKEKEKKKVLKQNLMVIFENYFEE